MKKQNKKQKGIFMEIDFSTFVDFLILISITIMAVVLHMSSKIDDNPISAITPVNTTKETSVFTDSGKMQKFASEDDFKKYLDEIQASNYGFSGYARSMSAKTLRTREMTADSMTAPQSADAGMQAVPERVSETNVQVKGIDEPDIVKTDGKEIFYSNRLYAAYSPRDRIFAPDFPPTHQKYATKIVKSFPIESLKLDSEVPENGELLLSENILAIFSYNKITGYDVSNPASPQEKWKIDMKENTQISASRLFNGKIYLITSKYINHSKPCPIEIMSANGSPVNIVCSDIYRPSIATEIDNTYTISIINPQNGSVENNISFVGSANNSIIYMSPNAIYATYYYNGDFIKFFTNFFTEKCSDLISSDIVNRLKKLYTYDIGQQAKYIELQNILSQINPSNADDQVKFESEFENRFKEYLSEHGRELENTGIFKISSSDLSILSQGNIPGALLNQFSLDEYDNHLRVASTIGEKTNMYWMGSSESVNDAYILDENLNITGKVLDMGKGEKIYSARFIGDKGYIVTFRQTDPFYVLDLSDPANPQLKGELKIPGYSSYLHPIDENRILGIGKEDNKIKISLFDVSSAENPKEIAKYSLDEYWSDILNTHHAFLLDPDHQIFFLPGTKGGYIFSYKNGELKLAKAISAVSAQRALYINNYLYIVGQDKITVLNENNWEKISELEL